MRQSGVAEPEQGDEDGQLAPSHADFSNAFHTVKRATVLAEVATCEPALKVLTW